MSDSVLDDILAKIEDHASTIDPWETNSSRSSIFGLGTTAGKTIMNVGIGILRVVDYITIRTTLARISRAQKRRLHEPLDDWVYRDILEYQRPGLYSSEVNIVAWRILMNELSRGHEEEIVKAALIPGFSRVDIQILVEQLIACSLTDWSCYPRAGNHHQIQLDNAGLPVSPRHIQLSFCGLLAALAERLGDPTLLLEMYKPNALVAFMLRDPLNTEAPVYSPNPHACFIVQALHMVSVFSEPTQSDPSSVCAIRMLAHLVDLDNDAQSVVAYIDRAIQVWWTSANGWDRQHLRLSKQARMLADMAVLLSIRSKEASVAFLEAGTFEVFTSGPQAWEDNTIPWVTPPVPDAINPSVQISLYVLALSTHNPVEVVLERLFHATPYMFKRHVATCLTQFQVTEDSEQRRLPLQSSGGPGAILRKHIHASFKSASVWDALQRTADRIVQPLLSLGYLAEEKWL